MEEDTPPLRPVLSSYRDKSSLVNKFIICITRRCACVRSYRSLFFLTPSVVRTPRVNLWYANFYCSGLFVSRCALHDDILQDDIFHLSLNLSRWSLSRFHGIIYGQDLVFFLYFMCNEKILIRYWYNIERERKSERRRGGGRLNMQVNFVHNNLTGKICHALISIFVTVTSH